VHLPFHIFEVHLINSTDGAGDLFVLIFIQLAAQITTGIFYIFMGLISYFQQRPHIVYFVKGNAAIFTKNSSSIF